MEQGTIKTVDAVIPVYRPGKSFEELLKRLSQQEYPLRRVIIMNTEEQYWNTEYETAFLAAGEGKGPKLQVHHLSKAEFDHGATRDRGIRLSDADVCICMTHDAVPGDARLVGNLVKALEAGEDIAAAYARQLPFEDCSVIETYTRSFNYPETSRIKSMADLKELGIKTYFCSNVCAAYRRDIYLKLGGFTKKTIFNEDMIFAGHAVEAGYQIAYAADAQVIHSHNYTAMQQLHRNFDLGVSQADHPEVFGRLHSEGEGIRLVKKTAKWLVENGHALLMPQLVMASGSKYAGYWLGKHYKKLPEGLIRSLTMNPAYWEGEAGDGR